MISTAELMDWLKAEPGDEALVRELERSAVDFVSEPGGRWFGAQKTIIEVLPLRAGVVQLASEPVGTVTVETGDGGAEWAAFADFHMVGRLVYLRGTTRDGFIRVTYTAGYAPDPQDPDVWPAPPLVRQAVRMLVGHWYENREAAVVGTISQEVHLGVQAIMRLVR